jgi:AcrR family transcriptional regulator
VTDDVDMTARRGAPRPASRRRRVGRPPRIDRGAIARAAGELPLEQVTMKAVADRLGVSVAALYHHVDNRGELLRLAAEQSALRMTLPRDENQHWAAWCYQWADYIRRAFAADPELLKQYIDGALGAEAIADHVEAAIALFVRQGFTEAEAYAVYELVSECALGAAITEIRAARYAAVGEPLDLQFRTVLARREPGALPGIRGLLAFGEPAAPPFADRIVTVLASVASERGDDPAETVRQVRAAAAAPLGSPPGTFAEGPDRP